jgi:hypothetical protein
MARPRKSDSRRAYRDDRYGTGYDTFRTGMTFRAVRRMMAGSSADPSTWRCRNRRAVLGFWHELKQQLWAQVQDALEGSR